MAAAPPQFGGQGAGSFLINIACKYLVRFLKKITGLHSVSRIYQGRQREFSVLTLRSPRFTQFSYSIVLVQLFLFKGILYFQYGIWGNKVEKIIVIIFCISTSPDWSKKWKLLSYKFYQKLAPL